MTAVTTNLDEVVEQPLGRVPYVTMRAFCETSACTSAITQAAADRRLSRADVTISVGGLRGAAQFFAAHPTPDLLVVETATQGDGLFAELEALAEVCDARTKVVLVGTVNDISLYKRVMESGVSEYLVSPTDPMRLIGAILKLFPQDASARLGKVLAFIGAKGGVGSSTVAQNTAWCLSRTGAKVLVADLDLRFGTAALNYNIDATVGFTEQLSGTERLDDAFFERVLYKYGPNLSVLAGATAARDVVPPPLEVLDHTLERARVIFPYVVLDLPHEWSPWVRQALLSADEVVVTAEPDLANLRNARVLSDLLKAARLNDAPPRFVLNRVGVPRRNEIKTDDFAAALGTIIGMKIGFAPQAFSKAANGGQMLAELSETTGRPFVQLAQELSGKSPASEPRKRLRWRRG